MFVISVIFIVWCEAVKYSKIRIPDGGWLGVRINQSNTTDHVTSFKGLSLPETQFSCL